MMASNNTDPLKSDITPSDSTQKRTIVKYLSFKAPNGSRTISDSNALVAYSDEWNVNLITMIDNPKQARTVHTTGVNGSYANLTFYGSKIYVIGFVPPGQSPLLVDYVIDDGEPQTKSLVASKANKTLGNQVLFESETLTMQNHKFSILVTGTGEGRNYTLDYFQVVGSENNANQSGTHNLSLILGVAWSMSILFIMSIGAFAFWWRRRRMRRNGSAGHVGDPLNSAKSSGYLGEEQEGSFDPYIYSESHMPTLPSLAYPRGARYKRHTFHMTSGAWRSFANPPTPNSDLQVERHNSLFTTRTSVTVVPHHGPLPNIMIRK